jgi:NhaA family Na+:H+ antiporter
MSWLAVKLKIARLPDNVSWKHLTGLGMLGGIGFTMSVFIALLSLDRAYLQQEAKFAILVASVFSGMAGFMYLKYLSKRQ